MDVETFNGLKPAEGNSVVDDELENEGLHGEDFEGEEGEDFEDSGEKEPYTPEEIAELLRREDFSAIDTERLDDQGKLIMKSFQKGLTPKLQERSEYMKRVQELEDKLAELEKSSASKPPATIEEAFDRDPERVLAMFDQEIARLEKLAEYDDKAAADLVQFKSKQRELVVRGITNSREQAENAKLESKQMTDLIKFDATLRRNIENFDQMVPKLGKFAVEELGYDPEELGKLTNPAIAGEAGVRNTLTIYRAYKAMNGDSLKGKRKPVKPVDLEDAGGGFVRQPNRSDLKKARKAVQENPTVDNMAVYLAQKRRARRKK